MGKRINQIDQVTDIFESDLLFVGNPITGKLEQASYEQLLNFLNNYFLQAIGGPQQTGFNLYDASVGDYARYYQAFNGFWMDSPDGSGGFVFSYGQKKPIFDASNQTEGLIDPIYILPDDTGTLALAEKTMGREGGQTNYFEVVVDKGIDTGQSTRFLIDADENPGIWRQNADNSVFSSNIFNLGSTNFIYEDQNIRGGYSDVYFDRQTFNFVITNDYDRTYFSAWDDNDLGGLFFYTSGKQGVAYLTLSTEENFEISRTFQNGDFFKYAFQQGQIQSDAFNSRTILSIPFGANPNDADGTIATREWVQENGSFPLTRDFEGESIYWSNLFTVDIRAEDEFGRASVYVSVDDNFTELSYQNIQESSGSRITKGSGWSQCIAYGNNPDIFTRLKNDLYDNGGSLRGFEVVSQRTSFQVWEGNEFQGITLFGSHPTEGFQTLGITLNSEEEIAFYRRNYNGTKASLFSVKEFTADDSFGIGANFSFFDETTNDFIYASGFNLLKESSSSIVSDIIVPDVHGEMVVKKADGTSQDRPYKYLLIKAWQDSVAGATSDPQISFIENTLGITPTCERIDQGNYRLIFPTDFFLGKRVVSNSNLMNDEASYRSFTHKPNYTNNDIIFLALEGTLFSDLYNLGVTETEMYNLYIEIKIYEI